MIRAYLGIIMNEAIRLYLSDMSESAKLAAIRSELTPWAVLVDSMTGSEIVKSWDSEDSEIDAAFINANWI